MSTGKKIFIFLVIPWLAVTVSVAQEILLSAPPYHPGTGSALTNVSRLKAAVLDTIEIPFIDDFSRLTGIPDTAIWSDNTAFINNSYSNNPVTIGMATLDAIDAEGNLNGDSDVPFRSDFLTSKPINLDFPGRNDIYLSFYYQPEGLGDEPEEDDSLLLELYAPKQYKWNAVWSVPGGPSTPFEQVFIHLNDTAYLHPGFQFRFVNYASLPNSQGFPSFDANVDHWNIDYVVLDTARSPAKTYMADVSMISNLPSFLKSYEAIPWSHFSFAFFTELRESLDISYYNHDEVVRNITRMLEIRDLYSGETYSESGGAINIDPGESGQHPFYPDYPFDFYSADSVVFEIKSYLVTEAGDYRWNDTVKRNQDFTDYYAYDDGTAEFGYGLSGEGSENAAVAVKYKSFMQDTLRGVRFYFNQALEEVNLYFSLAVWDHDEDLDQPGELIYSMSGNKREYTDELNRFRTYAFDTLLIVDNYFYVGWIKTRDDILNIGFDVNKNNQGNTYYNLGQSWRNSAFSGSLMLRPVMGKKITWPASAQSPVYEKLEVYPNPAADYVYISLPGGQYPERLNAEIYSLQGSLVYRQYQGDSRIDVSGLSNGIYILRLNSDKSISYTGKLIISR